MKRLLRPAVIAVLISATTMVVAGQARLWQTPLDCDRACLNGLVDAYVAALVAHDSRRVAMAPNAKFTENASVLPLTEGLWKNATQGPTTAYKIYVPDPVSGQVGFFTIMRELMSAAPPPRGGAVRGGAAGRGAGAPGAAGGAAPPPAVPPAASSVDRPIQLALRLKIENKRITEAEHLIARLGENDMANFQAVAPRLLQTVPPAERLSRELMLLIGNSYYNSIMQSDGDATPYADECSRRENGRGTAGAAAARGAALAGGAAARGGAIAPAPAPAPPGAAARGTGPAPGGAPAAGAAAPPAGRGARGCREQMFGRGLSYIFSIDLRRVWIADVEYGLVFGLTHFRHPYARVALNPDGTKGVENEGTGNPFDLPAAHIFKIQGGKMYDIEAMGFAMPLYSKNGWSEYLR